MINKLFIVIFLQFLLISCNLDKKIDKKDYSSRSTSVNKKNSESKSGIFEDLFNNDEKNAIIFFEKALAESRDDEKELRSVKTYTKKEFNNLLVYLGASNLKKDILSPIIKILKAKEEVVMAIQVCREGIRDGFEDRLESLEDDYLIGLKYSSDWDDFGIVYFNLCNYIMDSPTFYALGELKKFVKGAK